MRYEDLDETSPFNGHSPGPVMVDENLLRCGFHPENFDSGQLVSNILPIDHLKIKEDSEKSGCSVDRLAYSSREHVQATILNLSHKKPDVREREILIQFSCREIRDIRNDERSQAFKVIDIAFEHDTSHAAIIAAKEYKDSYMRKLRNIVLDLWRAKPLKTIADVFGVGSA